MKKNRFNLSFRILSLYSLTLILTLAFTSCHKELSRDPKSIGLAGIKINLASYELDENVLEPERLNESTKSDAELLGVISYSKGKNVEIILEPDKDKNPIIQKSISRSSSKQKAIIERRKLANRIKYNLLIYDNSGVLVTEREYISGNEGASQLLSLNVGKSYTFVAYSSNSESDVPIILNKNFLHEALISSNGNKLLFFKRQLTLTEGINYLDIVLKHQLCEMTVNLTIDEKTFGRITELSNVRMSPVKTSANLKVETGEMIYESDNSIGSEINFPDLGALGLRSVRSSQSLIINPETNLGTLKFGRITIDGETKDNLTINNIKIKPGGTYTLHLNFRTCTQETEWGSRYYWRHEEKRQNGIRGIEINGSFIPDNTVISKIETAPKADYGVVIDFVLLDNSFNMELNGVLLAKNEIQFQGNTYTAQNIMFEDGSKYEGTNIEGGANINTISSLYGSRSNPLIRVVISRHGEVSIFGSKINNGMLYPLKLYNGNSYNKFPWNKDRENVIKFTQLVDGRTYIEAYGSSRNKIPCSP